MTLAVVADMPVIAVDCHPWRGAIELTTLTATEVAADPELASPAEMAAWQHYCFSERLVSWRRGAALGAEMRAAYEAAAAESFARATDFRFTVTHPDNGREFVAGGAPEAEPGAEAGGEV